MEILDPAGRKRRRRPLAATGPTRRLQSIAAFLLALLAAVSAGSAVARAQPVVAYSARVAGDDHRARLVVDFDRRPHVSVHYVDSPPRILVDLPQTVFALQKGALAPRGLFDSIRYGAMGPGRSRIVLETKGPARVDMKRFSKGDAGTDARFVLDITRVSQTAFTNLVKAESWMNDGSGSADTAAAASPKGQRTHAFTVVIDPGHGGIDSGAVGASGTLEKNVTLAFGKQLAADLRAQDIHVVMTRTDDEFVSLADRVRIARENNADLFISVHANTIAIKGIRGATVYTLSDKASDRLSQRVAEDENKADAVAGVTSKREPKGVANILMDLTRRETQVFSIGLANKLVDSFEGKIRLINHPHRNAGFRVLEAPDVPSVLVEMGYLSNKADEKLLNDPDWRGKVARLMTQSIMRFRSTVLASRN